MKTVEKAIKKGRLRIAVLLMMMFMIIGQGQAWGAEPAWSQMGVSGINGINNANASSIVILNGTPYMAYTAYTGAGVVKYDGASWSAVGSSFTSDICNNVAMTASGSTLYVAYSNADYGRIEVKKFNTSTDTDWSDLGLANNSKALSQDSSLSLAVNSGSDIYLGYTDYSTSLFKVFHYDGSSWAWQFNVNGSTGCVTSVNGIAYAAYQDGSNYRLNQNSGAGWAQIQALNGPPLAMCHDDNGKIYILTKDVSSSNYLSVALYDTVSNTLSIVGSHIPVSSAYSPSISVDNGTVYVMYYISGGTSSLYAHESTADWVQVGPSLSLAYYGDMTAYNGTAYYAYSNQYNLAATKITYPVPVPKVTGINPDKGPETGGTLVDITGTNFTGATGVSFGAAPATSFTLNSSTSITATAPVGSGTVDVTVSGPAGTSANSSNDQFTYYQKPAVASISPVSGPAAGGTSVTIIGTNFTGTTAVSFGATPATGFTVSSPTSITATAPAGSGTVDVTVTGPGGTSAASSNDQFTYIQGPVVTGISPVSGSAAGGTSVSITGTNFTGATGVNFGATPTTGFTVNSPTSITATAPAGSGTVNVTVTGPGGTSATSSNDQFTYIQGPAVTGISPNNGPATGGTSVSITGTNFTGATLVSFGATPATSFMVSNPTSITATAPAGSGTVDVTVTGPGGTSAISASDQYTYQTLYTVSIGTVSGGSITASPTTAADGAIIDLTVTPTAGKQIKAGTLKYNDGTDHSITGASFTMPAANVTVTAEFETITVPLTDSEMAAEDKAALNIGYALGDNASSITQNLNFTTTGALYSSSITWVSSNTSVISNSGVITRPAFSSGDAAVTVTATVNKNGEIDTKTFSLTVLKIPQTTDGGSGSGGSGNTTPEMPKTDITVSGNTSIATTTAKATVDSSGKASAKVTREQINDAVGKAVAAAEKQDNGTSALVEVKVEADKDAKAVETKLPRVAFDALASSSITQLNVSTPVADITFDSNVLSAISDESSGDIKITASKVESSTLSTETQQVVGDRPVFNFSVASGDKIISQFGGNVSVSVPYSPKQGEDTNAIVIYYINAEGKPEIVSNCVYDPASGSITFNTNHFSQYAVGYNQVIFKDVAPDAWYSKAVSFIAAREITTGTGSDMFSPKAKLTRGQFIVMLMKAYGITPDMSPLDNFTDAGSTYYTGYLAAAKRMGITAGVGNNMSAPEKEITRQEMFTQLYNALKAIDKLPQGSSGESLSSFNDAGNIASWAKDAMKLFAETGIISGSGNKLSPKETTTRVQMAQVLYSLLSK